MPRANERRMHQGVRRRRRLRRRAYLEINPDDPDGRYFMHLAYQRHAARNRARMLAQNGAAQLRAGEPVNGDDSDTGSHDDGSTTSSASSNADALHDVIRRRLMPGVVSIYEHLLALVAIAVRCKQTYKNLLFIFTWLKVSNVIRQIPTSLYKLRKAFDWDDSNYTRHAYCGRCKRYFGVYRSKISCPSACCINRPNKVSYFLQIKIYEQLHELLQLPYITRALQYREQRIKYNPTAIEDVFDGIEYRNLSGPRGFLNYKYNFSFTLNTDGCSISKSSKASVWPVFLRINELHPLMRKKHLLLAGVFCDEQKPDMNLFLKCCLGELNELYDDGIQWTNSDAEQVTSRFIVVNFSTDTVARPLLLNMKQFNGAFGCGYCFQEGTKNRQNPGVRVYPLITQGVRYRTDASMRTHMTSATLTRQSKYGVKGSAFLRTLPLFNLVKGSIIDCMHCIYLGVIKKHMTLLLKSTNTNYYIGSPAMLSLIDKRLKAIQTPSCVSRTPRSIRDYKVWKASEWRNWLLFYCVPCLTGILPPQYIRHISLLAQAMYIFEQDSIEREHLIMARVWLKTYVKNFQLFFGKNRMVFNIHLLTHVADCIENWGPSWCNSCFIFESWNHHIIRSVTSPKGRLLQIADRFIMMKTIATAIYDDTVSDITKKFIAELFPSLQYNKNPIVFSNENDRGRYHATCTPIELQTCTRKFFYDVNYRGIDYRESGRNPNTKFCDSFIHCNGIGFAEIVGIVKFNINSANNSGFYVKMWEVVGNPMDVRHLYRIAPTRVIVYISFADNYFKPAIVVSRRLNESHCSIVTIPNVWEND